MSRDAKEVMAILGMTAVFVVVILLTLWMIGVIPE